MEDCHINYTTIYLGSYFCSELVICNNKIRSDLQAPLIYVEHQHRISPGTKYSATSALQLGCKQFIVSEALFHSQAQKLHVFFPAALSLTEKRVIHREDVFSYFFYISCPSSEKTHTCSTTVQLLTP